MLEPHLRRARRRLKLALEARDHGEAELRRAGAVDDAVVERDRDRPDLADDDLAVADDRPLARSGRCRGSPPRGG